MFILESHKEDEPINGAIPDLMPPRPMLMSTIPTRYPGSPAPASKAGGKDVTATTNAPVT